MDIEHYSVSESGYAPGHCCEGADVLEHSPALAFELDVPGSLQLRCSTIEVHEIERVEIVPAWFSERGFHARFPGRPPLDVVRGGASSVASERLEVRHEIVELGRGERGDVAVAVAAAGRVEPVAERLGAAVAHERPSCMNGARAESPSSEGT
ncbi:hypothetical protein [Sorangium sp. So ce1024]